MTGASAPAPAALRNGRWGMAGDVLAAALAAALPWSTSATEILAWLWLLSLIPTVDRAALRRMVTTPAGGLPLLLFLLAVAGMLWAIGIPFHERVNGLKSFYKLLFVAP